MTLLISGVASDQWLPDAELEKWSAPKLETYAEPVQEKQAFQPWEPLSHNTQMGSDFRQCPPFISLRINQTV